MFPTPALVPRHLMKTHLLLALAERFATREPVPSDGWVYDRSIGTWVFGDRPPELMANPKPPPQQPWPPKPRPGPASKKGDLETGEDMKGS